MGNIVRESMYKEAMSVSLKYISRRDRTEYEVIKRLKKDGCPSKIVDMVMPDLKEQGYINDKRYAEYYIVCYKDKRSVKRIMQALKKKGIDDDLLSEVMENADIDMSEAVRKALKKQLAKRGISDTDNISYEDREKVMAALFRQGYPAEDIRKEMDSIFEK